MKKISRNRFLKTAAALAAGTVVTPMLHGWALPAPEEAEPCKGDVVLLLSNDIHSNLGPSKQMGQDGVTHITGGVARMAAAQAQIRRRAAGKYLTLDGGDYSQGTPYQDGYQKGWEILALAQMEVDFCTLGNHEFDVGDQAVANAWSAARDNALRYGVDHSLPQLLVSNLFIKYDAEGHDIRYTAADIRPEDLSTNPFGSGAYGHAGAKNYVVKRVGEHLVVCPSWEEYQPQEGDVMLTLNPGMAFGTGTHDTTRLCMELLEKYITPEDSVLDVGCGSGILAITAALLGAKEIKGCDIDEVAVKVAGENAALNKVADRIAFHKGDLTSQVEGSFQLICANIVADVIIRLSRDVGKYLAQDGIFITSGIIDTREQDVQDALAANGFTVIERRTSGGWVALACKAK